MILTHGRHNESEAFTSQKEQINTLKDQHKCVPTNTTLEVHNESEAFTSQKEQINTLKDQHKSLIEQYHATGLRD
ncbi:hypothetical protein T484DRAFT_1846260 [Baffinella frigidus]|nr:hypothetical protein T484DRAFT_1846260 [Cryptophyta sp. CCMP2293]